MIKMNSSDSRLAYLFGSYYNKTITKQESEELIQLLQQATDDELTDLLREVWENPATETPLFESAKSTEILNWVLKARDKQENVINFSKKRKYALNQKLAAAAAVLIFISFGIYFGLRSSSENIQDKQIAVKNELINDALPGGNKATLTLSNGKTLILDGAQNGVLAEQGNITVSKAKDGQLIYHVAGNTANQNIAFNTLSTPPGGQYQVVLPDGSKVWLNAASSLRFPALFKGQFREVKLTGEAYFEVAKNPDMPFKVKSGLAEVEVLGTHFNIMAYDNESAMKTTLLEGAVKIKSGTSTNILKPGEQAVLNKAGRMDVIENINIDEAIAWKNGLFQFNDTDVQSVMRQAARWYDLDVSYEGQIPKKRFTGRISRNVKASELLKILEYTGISFRIQGKKIIVTN